MLAAAGCVVLTNLYGLVAATAIRPLTPTILTTSILTIILACYIETNKRRILIENYRRESFLLFALILLFQLYYLILALTLLVYLSNAKNYSQTDLSPFIVGWGTLSEN